MKVPLIEIQLGRRGDRGLTWRFTGRSSTTDSDPYGAQLRPRTTDVQIARGRLVKKFGQQAERVEVYDPCDS